MNAVKNSALLLAFGAPFILYAAWQVRGAAGGDAGGSAPPADAGQTREQLAATGAKASQFADESRKALDAAQSTAGGPAPVSSEPAVAETLKAATARTADLADLERFLSGAEKPVFAGKLKPRYEEWAREQVASKRAEDAVRAWLRKPPPVAGAADADKALTEVGKLIDEAAGQSRFANKGRAAEWRLRARLHVIDQLTKLANKQYADAANAKLPLDPGTNAATTAVSTLDALKKQLNELKQDLQQADEAKTPLDPALRKEAAGKGANADEYAAREELLTLFAKPDLFDNAGGAEAWLKSVAEQYAKTKDTAVQKLIRSKVQEFADAFVPPAAQLDDKVLVKGAEVPRKDVVIKYQEREGGETKRAQLSGDFEGTNEFNFEKKYPGDGTFVVAKGSEEVPGALKPTDLSRAALAYNAARAKLAERPAPRWTPESVAALKKACEAQRELVDQLRLPERKGAGAAPKVATRVLGLAAGMAACDDLFRPER